MLPGTNLPVFEAKQQDLHKRVLNVSNIPLDLCATQMLGVCSVLAVEVVAGGGGDWRVCAVGLLGYNCQCCFKKSWLRLVSVNTANKIVKNDKV